MSLPAERNTLQHSLPSSDHARDIYNRSLGVHGEVVAVDNPPLTAHEEALGVKDGVAVVAEDDREEAGVGEEGEGDKPTRDSHVGPCTEEEAQCASVVERCRCLLAKSAAVPQLRDALMAGTHNLADVADAAGLVQRVEVGDVVQEGHE